MKDKLGEKIMNQFIEFRAKAYCYLITVTKKCVTKMKLKIENNETV